jgi:iron(III) transport system ATP-binding protein
MLAVRDLRKRYKSSDGTLGGGVFGVSFDIANGELFTLLGPSGCGKTTTLRSIAGLELPDSGSIALHGKEIFSSERRISVPMHKRDIGMVFQSYAIWPHMNVFDNAAYPLRTRRRRRLSRQEVDAKVSGVLEMVGLSEYRNRPATQLSGGQQQRLALARALTREPSLLLLDEPLSNLDAQLREQMRSELLRLQRETGLTSIYVTHDQTEALALSDRIAVIKDGLIVQIGSPEEIYNRPATSFVASFIGKSNFITGSLKSPVRAGEFSQLDTPVGRLRCWFNHSMGPQAGISLVVRPENITVAQVNGAGPIDLPEENRISGVLSKKTFLGEISECAVRVDGIESEIVLRTPPSHAIKVGDKVFLHLPPDKTIAVT